MISVKKIELDHYGDFYCLHKEGKLLSPVNECLIHLALYGGRQGGKLSRSSQRQYAYVYKQLFDYYENNSLSWDEVNTEALK